MESTQTNKHLPTPLRKLRFFLTPTPERKPGPERTWNFCGLYQIHGQEGACGKTAACQSNDKSAIFTSTLGSDKVSSSKTIPLGE